jgi:hypothetical protein
VDEQLLASQRGLCSKELVYRAYFVITDNILMWICEVWFATI